jgi:hypothetical protein
MKIKIYYIIENNYNNLIEHHFKIQLQDSAIRIIR